ncbi:MAG TPA: hypothetical protein VFV87_07415, partial [Pirellulaceae bacterium]|nr:hypothetical protein [Pirellulaceae bacterium]
EFGWSLPAGEGPFGAAPLASLLGQAGLGWAKLPVWYDAHDNQESERIAWFAEQLSIQGIELVGVLDQPPKELRQVFREEGRLPVASVFAEPELWEPAVSPVLTRLSLRIRWWQLGEDQDTSFVGMPQAEAKIGEIRRRLEQYGQELRLGVGWRWLHPTPELRLDDRPPWSFLSYNAEPALTAAELSTYLAPAGPAEVKAASKTLDSSLQRRSHTPRPGWSAQVAPPSAVASWVMLSPLAREEYTLSARVQDLAQRMLSARVHGASAVFVPLPFDASHGLINADGSPGELFVPWRTTATLVGGAEYLGSIQLPGGSTCHAFGRDGQAVLAIWNEQPTTERLTLDDGVEQIDVWGQNVLLPIEAQAEPQEREIAVGPLPTFLIGQSEGVARWQATVDFESLQVASVFNVEQSINLKIRNPFNQGISGEVKLQAPASWGVDPRPTRFKIAVGDELRLALPVTLLADANSGPQPVRLDFEITADRNYRFSVYRTLQLGLDDVQIELRTKLRNDGALIVEQQLNNLSERPVSFQCLLFPQGRRREIRQVINAQPGQTATTYILPRGEELIGQRLLLRAEEIGGPRVLNYTLTGER